jgi:hypothetical protein
MSLNESSFIINDVALLLYCSSTAADNIPEGVNVKLLEGSKYLMPMYFRSSVVQLYQDRLLRAGYACVLFTDTDEMVVPNPMKYPQGLKQYLSNFVASKLPYIRVDAYELGHMSYGNGTLESQEKKLDWNRPILQQRKYYVKDPKYNKLLLTKTKLAYRPGFHRLYDHKLEKVPTDENLVLFHLRSMDYDFCMKKEVEKLEMTRNMEQDELNVGFAEHWFTSERNPKYVCMYAIACYSGELLNSTTVFDNTGVFPMRRLEDYWQHADL